MGEFQTGSMLLMRPLASPVAEYRVLGLLTAAGGVVLGVVGAAVQNPVMSGLGFAVAVGITGPWMYWLAYGRFARKAVREPAPAPPPAGREPENETRRRAALTAGVLLVFMAIVGLATHALGVVGGIAAGNGAALTASGHWLRRWEKRNRLSLLREPRWRWSRRGAHGWGRGRGMMDPQDFYVIAPGDRSTSA